MTGLDSHASFQANADLLAHAGQAPMNASQLCTVQHLRHRRLVLKGLQALN